MELLTKKEVINKKMLIKFGI